MLKKLFYIIIFALAVALAYVTTTSGQQIKPQNPNVKISRGEYPQLKPKITDASYICIGASCTEFVVRGQYFGTGPGSRRLLVNGVPIPHQGQWTPQQIAGFGPLWDVDHSYDIAIDDGAQVISNVLTKRYPYQWDSVQPGHGLPGTEVVLIGWSGGPAQTDKVIKMGSAVMTVISWAQTPGKTENTIHARVPGLPPGVYQITMNKGGVNINKSPGFNFSVY
jgi:hypothetical protein